MASNTKPIANPLIVLREEFDDWAILFDPDTGNAFGLNPLSVLIWKKLDGRNNVEDIHKEVCMACKNVPEDSKEHIQAFIDDLSKNGLSGYEL